MKLLYSAIRDVTDAFVGERKGFDRPVTVTVDEANGIRVVGFLTRESLGELGLPELVAVYLPQSYNFAGMMVLVPGRLVTPLEVKGADAMAFVVSGGAAEIRGGRSAGSGGDRDETTALAGGRSTGPGPG